jgi:hypothetical protein
LPPIPLTTPFNKNAKVRAPRRTRNQNATTAQIQAYTAAQQSIILHRIPEVHIMRLTFPALVLGLLVAQGALAGETSTAVGGGLGGALGNIVGQKMGGSTGAALGAGVGGAAGSAVGAKKGTKVKAAIGGGLGSAGGSLLGNKLGGSTGGTIGAGLGGAAGGAIAGSMGGDKKSHKRHDN